MSDPIDDIMEALRNAPDPASRVVILPAIVAGERVPDEVRERSRAEFARMGITAVFSDDAARKP